MSSATVHEISEANELKKHTISLVPMDHCSKVWNQVRFYFSDAVDRSNGRWSLEHLLASFVSGHYQLWIAYDDEKTINGVLATQVVYYPCKTCLALHFLGGVDFDNWYDDLLKEITIFAKESGCDALEGVARKGFWKWFKNDGFVREATFYEKELDHG
jgi:hypothetical protein